MKEKDLPIDQDDVLQGGGTIISFGERELGLAEVLGLLLLLILRALGARDLGLLLAGRSSRSRCCLSLLGGRGLRTLCFDIW